MSARLVAVAGVMTLVAGLHPAVSTGASAESAEPPAGGAGAVSTRPSGSHPESGTGSGSTPSSASGTGSAESVASDSSDGAPPIVNSGSRAAELPGSVDSLVLGIASSGTGHDPSTSGSLGPSTRTWPESDQGSEPGYHHYVALGDSYAAMGSVLPGRWSGGPPQCIRTADSYPSVLAESLRPTEFVDATCAGAVTGHLWGPRDGIVPPQFDALRSDTDLVTLSIGGNDVGFAEVVATCVLPAPLGAAGPVTAGSVVQAGGELLSGVAGSVLGPGSADLSATASSGASAERTVTAAGIDAQAVADAVNRLGTEGADPRGGRASGSLESAVSPGSANGSIAPVRSSCRTLLTEEIPERIDALAESLDAVYDEIRRRSPRATVVATGYLAMLPLDGSRCPILDSVSGADLTALRDFELAIDAAVAAAAERHGALAVTAVDRPGQDVCAPPGGRGVDLLGFATGAGAFHPTRVGQWHMARAIHDLLDDSGPGRGELRDRGRTSADAGGQ